MSNHDRDTSWNVATLKEHLEREIRDLARCMTTGFAAQSEATSKALASAQTAVDKAERLADLRAETQDRLAEATKVQQNEWRASLSDMTGTYVTKDEYGLAHTVLVEKLDRLQVRLDRAEGQAAGSSKTVNWLFAGVGVLIGLSGFLFAIVELLTH